MLLGAERDTVNKVNIDPRNAACDSAWDTQNLKGEFDLNGLKIKRTKYWISKSTQVISELKLGDKFSDRVNETDEHH